MGIAILWIILHHVQYFHMHSFPILNYLIRTGSCGVDIFLFLSSFGLYHALESNKSLKRYYYRRVLRILPTFIIFIIIKDLFFCPGGILSYENWVTELRNNWFISFILIMYISYPIVYYIQKKATYLPLTISIIVSISLTLLLIKFGRCDIHNYYTLVAQRFPIFMMGSIVAEKNNLMRINNRGGYICLVIVLLCIPTLFNLDLEYLLYPLYFVLTPLLISFLSIHSIMQIKPFMNKIGELSLEIYLIHMLVIPLLVSHSIIGILGIILTIISTFPIAFILHKTTNISTLLHKCKHL